MAILQSLRSLFCRFSRDERGVISTEMIIVTPLLVWIFLALFVYWDGFRAKNTAVKATVAVADMISRESASINSGYITGMHRVYRYATGAQRPSWMRVTLIQYSEASAGFRVLWSRSTDSSRAAVHSNRTIAEMRHNLPNITDADTLMVVETWQEWTPAFWVGLSEQVFYEMSTEKMRAQALLPIT
ncbi:TadE/TadG family type IV pilus assembly protein [Falsigemmobacter faecalis]|uniref:Pilus assembly protein n=1 Tax=Falsigemmobacter faecalis TaxID=2488730 RepID=A0A3P3DSB3_9RHOB|nr:hypothetical protein [Falsigemmobacter faecalis]RRH76432.1 hypothetical protein EG244_06670 [Falsigemmobacter faecalis]